MLFRKVLGWGEFKTEPAFERGDRHSLAKRREEGFPGKEIITPQGVETRTRGAQTGEHQGPGGSHSEAGGCWGRGIRGKGGEGVRR